MYYYSNRAYEYGNNYFGFSATRAGVFFVKLCVIVSPRLQRTPITTAFVKLHRFCCDSKAKGQFLSGFGSPSVHGSNSRFEPYANYSPIGVRKMGERHARGAFRLLRLASKGREPAPFFDTLLITFISAIAAMI